MVFAGDVAFLFWKDSSEYFEEFFFCFDISIFQSDASNINCTQFVDSSIHVACSLFSNPPLLVPISGML